MNTPYRQFDHEYVERNAVLERYRARRLDAEDSDAFEIHYLDCERCQAALAADDALAEGLKLHAANALASPPKVHGARSRILPLYAAAASVVLVVGAGLITWRAVQPPAALSTQIVPLLAQRDSSAGVTDIRVDDEPGLVVLMIDAVQPEIGSYDVSLVGGQDRVIWQARGITPKPVLEANRLVVSVPSGALSSGEFVVRVAGTRSDGSTARVADFPLRVNRTVRQSGP